MFSERMNPWTWLLLTTNRLCLHLPNNKPNSEEEMRKTSSAIPFCRGAKAPSCRRPCKRLNLAHQRTLLRYSAVCRKSNNISIYKPFLAMPEVPHSIYTSVNWPKQSCSDFRYIKKNNGYGISSESARELHKSEGAVHL